MIKVTISGIPSNLNSEELNSLIAPLGFSAEIPEAGMAVMTVNDLASAQNLVSALMGVTFKGNELVITVGNA